jgi:hypothetical protein
MMASLTWIIAFSPAPSLGQVSGTGTSERDPSESSAQASQSRANRDGLPGDRLGAAEWIGEDGVRWLFGGLGTTASGQRGFLDDLWRYDRSSRTWTWVKGSHLTDQRSSSGPRGVPAATNSPGARFGATSWIGARGHLWLFGGVGASAKGEYTTYEDLWRFDPQSRRWTWVTTLAALEDLALMAMQQNIDLPDKLEAALRVAFMSAVQDLGHVEALDALVLLGRFRHAVAADGDDLETRHLREILAAIDATMMSLSLAPAIESQTLSDAVRMQEEVVELPRTLEISGNYPNPFNSSTRFRFYLPEREVVSLVVYDVTGRTVKRVAYSDYSSGYHVVEWDGRTDSGAEASSGVYLYRITAGPHSETGRMTLLR